MPVSEGIYGKIVKVLVESLSVDEDHITPAARLQGDLGAESIDFLDIVFRLEREFGVRIPRGELFPESVFQRDPDFVRDGRVTEQGMREIALADVLRRPSVFDQDRRLAAVPDLFTVGLVVRYVEWKLGQCVEAGPNGAGAIPVTSSASSVHRE